MMMKSMRDATPQDGMFDSQQSQDVHLDAGPADQPELGQAAASAWPTCWCASWPTAAGTARWRSAGDRHGRDAAVRGNAARCRQALARCRPTPPGRATPARRRRRAAQRPATPGRRTCAPSRTSWRAQPKRPAAPPASRPSSCSGQAALEIGLGQARDPQRRRQLQPQPVRHQGRPGLEGQGGDVATTEYVNGEPQKRVEKFRAYDSYADVVQATTPACCSNNPRYENVLANARRRQRLRAGPAARRLRHRPAIRRQADPDHQAEFLTA